MDDVRSVANQRQSFPDELASSKQPERKCAPGPDHLELAQLQAKALLQFGMEFGIRKRDDSPGLVSSLRPHNRAAPAGQRQNRERAFREKMLFGAATVLALVRDCGDNRRLIVVPSMRGDSGLLADQGIGAVRPDKQAC